MDNGGNFGSREVECIYQDSSLSSTAVANVSQGLMYSGSLVRAGANHYPSARNYLSHFFLTLSTL